MCIHFFETVGATATAAAAPAPGIAPNPSLGNAANFEGSVAADPNLFPPFVVALVAIVVLAAAAVAALELSSCALCRASASFLAFSSFSSRSRSYPSCLILSASSIALRSASAKSTGLVLAAPKPSFDLFGRVLEAVVDPADEAEFKREVPAPRRPGRAAAEEVSVLGEVGVEVVVAGATMVLVLVLVVTEADRPIMGGVAMRGVPGLDDLGVEGLDQESKKSSSVSSLAAAAAVGASIPSTTIPLGNLTKSSRLLTFVK